MLLSLSFWISSLRQSLLTTKCCRRLKQELQAASYHKHEAIGEAAWEDYLSDLAEGCLRLQLMGVHHLSPVKVAVGEGTENARGKIQIKKKEAITFRIKIVLFDEENESRADGY